MDRGLWHCRGGRDQNHPQEKEMEQSKIVVWGRLTNSSEKKRSERQRRKWKIYPFECRIPKIARRDTKAFLSDQSKGIEENNRMGKTRDPFKKIGDTKGTFHANMGTIKDRNVGTYQKQKILRRGDKNTQKNCTKNIFMSQITTMVWSLTGATAGILEC